MDITDLNNYGYEECRDLFKQIRYYINDKNMINTLSQIIEKKKIAKYPELLKPTYYPEIDLLDISDTEKIRLDKAVRNNYKVCIKVNNIEKLTYPLSIEDLELLKSIGIVEKKYNFRCEYCGSSCGVISESDLEKFKRFWKLFELEKQKVITDEQLNELDFLKEGGFCGIYLSCIKDEYECDDIKITSERELTEYMNNVEIMYKIIKIPDLTYEEL